MSQEGHDELQTQPSATCVSFQTGPPFLQHHDGVGTRHTGKKFPLILKESSNSDLTRTRLSWLLGIDALGHTTPSGFRVRSKRLKATIENMDVWIMSGHLNTNKRLPIADGTEQSVETQFQGQIA